VQIKLYFSLFHTVHVTASDQTEVIGMRDGLLHETLDTLVQISRVTRVKTEFCRFSASMCFKSILGGTNVWILHWLYNNLHGVKLSNSNTYCHGLGPKDGGHCLLKEPNLGRFQTAQSSEQRPLLKFQGSFHLPANVEIVEVLDGN